MGWVSEDWGLVLGVAWVEAVGDGTEDTGVNRFFGDAFKVGLAVLPFVSEPSPGAKVGTIACAASQDAWGNRYTDNSV